MKDTQTIINEIQELYGSLNSHDQSALESTLKHAISNLHKEVVIRKKVERLQNLIDELENENIHLYYYDEQHGHFAITDVSMDTDGDIILE